MPKTRGGGTSGAPNPIKRRRKDSDESTKLKAQPVSNSQFSIPDRHSQCHNVMSHNRSLQSCTSVAAPSKRQTPATSDNLCKRLCSGNDSTSSDTNKAKNITKKSAFTGRTINNSVDFPLTSLNRYDSLTNVGREVTAVGRIANIKLRNFMNHSALDLSPINRVNIVTGANGAGKSSILQALTLGLGTFSYNTRGTNVS